MFLCKLTPHMCKWGISIFNGKSGAINATRTSVYMAHTPAGTSTKTILHYSQMINSGKFGVTVDAEDDWTVYTGDGKKSAQYEHTILVTDTGCEVLTLRPDDTIPRIMDNA